MKTSKSLEKIDSIMDHVEALREAKRIVMRAYRANSINPYDDDMEILERIEELVQKTIATSEEIHKELYPEHQN